MTEVTSKSLDAGTTAHGDTLGGVPARYTWKQVSTTVATQRAAGASLRGIAKFLNARAGAGRVVISHRVVQRILEGHEPQHAGIRAALGLPALVPTVVCPTCGVVHVSSRCPNKPKAARQPRYRPTVREVRGYAALVLALLSGAK